MSDSVNDIEEQAGDLADCLIQASDMLDDSDRPLLKWKIIERWNDCISAK